MLPDGSGTVGTGEFEQLKTDSLVLAVGEHADLGVPEVACPASRSGATTWSRSTRT